jgi:hypothetical protein
VCDTMTGGTRGTPSMNRRLRILESNHGRDGGWYVEVDGRRLAALSDCRREEMFWDSYLLDPLTAEVGTLWSEGFWDRCGRITFRSREFGDVAPHALACLGAGAMLKESGRLVVRGLYLVVPRRPWDGLLPWARKSWKLWPDDRRPP